MYIAKIVFSLNERAPDDSHGQAIYNLLASLLHDGRIGPDYQILDEGMSLTALVAAPAADSFDDFSGTPYIPNFIATIIDAKISPPTFEILGRAMDFIDVCRCADAPGYILYTHYAAGSISPLHCFDCFNAVPLYRLPRLKSGEFFEIYVWQSDYRSCDRLQMHCQTGERFALREMSRLDSSLTRAGLDICRELSSLTGKPFYYHLYKHYGRSERQERARKCPSCGGEWLLTAKFHDLFEFRCDRCRLLSNVAYSLR